MFKLKVICIFSVLSLATGSAFAGPTGGKHGGGVSYEVVHESSEAVYEVHAPVQGRNRPVHHKKRRPVSHRGGYAGAGFGRSDMSVDGVSESFEDTNFRAYLGYDLNRYFAVEGGLGVIPLEDYLNDVGDLTGIDVSVLAKLPVTSRLSAYARLGYWDWDFSDPDKSKSHSFAGGTDMLYGIGLDYNVSPRFKLRLDATRYEASDADIDTINGSIAYRW